jgi:hypothetical protein
MTFFLLLYSTYLNDRGSEVRHWFPSNTTTDFSALMMDPAHTSETSVYFSDTTRRYIPEGCLYARRRENLKSNPQIQNAASLIGKVDGTYSYHSALKG